MFDGRHDYMDMTGKDYDRLYARYVGRNLDKLILAAGPVEGKRVLDLCAGSGAVAKRAKELGAASVTAADKSRKMLGGLFEQGVDQVIVLEDDPRDVTLNNIAEQVGTGYDLVISRQAVNYWWNINSLGEAMLPLKPGGVFLFNTFHGDTWTNAHHPSTSEYKVGILHYAEVWWLDDTVIRHVQCCEGMPPHITTFDYISRGVFQLSIEDHGEFISEWHVERDGNTDIYMCQRGGTSSEEQRHQ
jgi:SAM-dependent methyltransferase